jgi:hypothetical protein
MLTCLLPAPPPGCSAGSAPSRLVLPDEAGVLRPVLQLAYNDAPWLERQGPGAGFAAAWTQWLWFGFPLPPHHTTVQLLVSAAPDPDSCRAGPQVHFIHPDISAAAAERLGAASLRRLLLAQVRCQPDTGTGARKQPELQQMQRAWP